MYEPSEKKIVLNKGYHYIRYATLGIYLLLLAKAVDWVANDVAPLGAIKWLGLYISVFFIVIDVRNYLLWRKNEDKNPGFPIVTWMLLLFYISGGIWFLRLSPSLRVNNWYPSSVEGAKELEQKYDSLRKERADLATYASELSKLQEELKQERQVLEAEKQEFEKGQQERNRLRVEFEKESDALLEKKALLAKTNQEIESHKAELDKSIQELSKHKANLELESNEVAKAEDLLNSHKLRLNLNKYASISIIVGAGILTLHFAIFILRQLFRWP